MALTLYRRHRLECEAAHPEDSRSGDWEEHRKGWKRCNCGIHLSGSLGGNFSRKAAGTPDWEKARQIADVYEKADSWTGTKVAPAVLEPAPEKPRMTIADACGLFITSRESAGLAPATLRKYHTFTKQITAYADSQGYIMLDQITAADIDLFWSAWKLGARAKGKRLTTLRAFFRFCLNRKWIPESPVSSDIKPPVGSSKAANKAPFTDDELQRIIDACDQVTVEWKNETGVGAWTGEDLKDLIWLMVYTGFRISDATFFDIKRLKGNQVFIRATKNGGDVFAYIPDWLRDRLLARAERSGTRPFIVARSVRLETVTNIWRRRLAKAFEAAGPFEEPATPHRFRHTFARILLQRGVSVADVADLIGDDEKTVREHYARWVPERQARLTTILKDSFQGLPTPRLTVLHGGRH
ncbi:MAG TPA: site-specific integrase [Vicinamibacterales bacterium]|jgi:integrase